MTKDPKLKTKLFQALRLVLNFEFLSFEFVRSPYYYYEG